jgi:hypothetical protein
MDRKSSKGTKGLERIYLLINTLNGKISIEADVGSPTENIPRRLQSSRIHNCIALKDARTHSDVFPSKIAILDTADCASTM